MNKEFRLKNLLLFLLIFLPFLCVAQDKIALIIGNNDYQGRLYNDLPTCTNDAEEMNKCLIALGYQTIIIKDATREEILNAFKSLDKQLNNNISVGVFYYSGHASYIDNDYCIIPAKTEIEINSLKNDCIDIKQIATSLKKKCNFSFLFFDACRDSQTSSDDFKGIANLQQTACIDDIHNQQFICYATGKGDVARVGKGRLSPFTKVLTSHIFDNKSFARIWKESIMIEVPILANGQYPVIENTFDEDNVHFCFNESGVKSIYDANQNPYNNKVGITFNVNPKSKIKFGNQLYDSGKELIFNIGSTYTYTIEHIGYETYSGVIDVNNSTPSCININLNPTREAKLKVICEKPTNAKVYIDGIYKGLSPITITTTSGKHDIKVVADRYYSKSTKIELIPGENKPYKVMLTKNIPDWFDFDDYSGAHHFNYHFSPKYQIGLSYMFRIDGTRFSIGAMLASSTGFYKGLDLSTITVSTSTSISTSITTTVDDGYGNIVSATVKTSTTSGGINDKYSSEIDPYDEAKQYDANLLFLGNFGFNICNGMMLEAGIGGAYQQKRYYMSDTYTVTKTTTINNLTGELIGKPQYEYNSLGQDKWYKGENKWSLAIRLGAKFFIPLDNFGEYSITLGGGYTYLPMNHKYSSYDVTVGFCWYF